MRFHKSGDLDGLNRYGQFGAKIGPKTCFVVMIANTSKIITLLTASMELHFLVIPLRRHWETLCVPYFMCIITCKKQAFKILGIIVKSTSWQLVMTSLSFANRTSSNVYHRVFYSSQHVTKDNLMAYNKLDWDNVLNKF